MKRRGALVVMLLAGLMLSRDGLSQWSVNVNSGMLTGITNKVQVEITKPLDGSGSVKVRDQKIIDALTKSAGSGSGDMSGTTGELTNMPETWQEVVKMQGLQSVSSATGDQYEAKRSHYDAQVLKTLSSQTSLQSSRVIDAYGRSGKTSAAALAMAEVSYNGIKARLDKIRQAQSQIAATANVKQAIDLTNQLVVNVASLQAEILRVQTVQTALLATTADRENQVLASRREFFGASALGGLRGALP